MPTSAWEWNHGLTCPRRRTFVGMARFELLSDVEFGLTCFGLGLSARITPMFLPRFTIRTMLLVAAAVAVASVFAGQAMGGRMWGVGLTVGLLSIPAAIGVQSLFFLLGSAFASWLGPQEIIARTSRGGVERTGPSPVERKAATASVKGTTAP